MRDDYNPINYSDEYVWELKNTIKTFLKIQDDLDNDEFIAECDFDVLDRQWQDVIEKMKELVK